MVFSCVPVRVSTHHHILHVREACAITLVSADCCRKYKIALKGWRKAPAVVNTCEDNTNHVIISARAVRRKLFFFFFFASLEASPFHPRAITSTHTLNPVGWWAGRGGRTGSQRFLDSISDKDAARACFPESRGLYWGCWEVTGICQDSREMCLRDVKVKVIWHFKEWQQELMLGIWSVSGIKN